MSHVQYRTLVESFVPVKKKKKGKTFFAVLNWRVSYSFRKLNACVTAINDVVILSFLFDWIIGLTRVSVGVPRLIFGHEPFIAFIELNLTTRAEVSPWRIYSATYNSNGREYYVSSKHVIGFSLRFLVGISDLRPAQRKWFVKLWEIYLLILYLFYSSFFFFFHFSLLRICFGYR